MRAFCIFLLGYALLLAPSIVQGSPASVPASSMDLSHIGSLEAMGAWLDDLHAEALRAKKEDRLTFELQEQILKKSGESISKILRMDKPARLGDAKAAKLHQQAFEKNEAILRFVMACNEQTIERLQEEKLDQVEDTQAFIDSDAWQLPHRLNSLARYWMSWSGYYRSFLHSEDDPARKALLDEAVTGFSLTLLDVAEQAIVAKSLFGRALCFKEMGHVEKAAKDFEAIAEHVRHNDPLYMWSLYELALIRYRSRDYEAARAHLDKLEKDVEDKTVSEVLGDEHRSLRERVVLEPRARALLAEIEKQGEPGGEEAKALYREALRVLNRLSPYDPDYATRLYRLVQAAPFYFFDLADEEMGSIGCLALADARFQQGEYAEAVKRYRYLWASREVSIRKRMDDVYFRSGYAYCQTGHWKEALAAFDKLYTEFPRSGLVGKAVCLEYVAAAGHHRQAPGPSSYARRLEASRKYLQACPNPRDRSGAHFFLGKDYEKRGSHQEARREFAAVEEASSLYWPARYYILKDDVEDLERRKEAGEGQTADTRRLYRSLVTQFEKFGRLTKDQSSQSGDGQIAPQMAILEARTFRSAPEASCEKAGQALEGFEKRFPENEGLWLTAMRLRLACCLDLHGIGEAKRQVEMLLRDYPVDQDLWDFLAEWAGAYDGESDRWREEGRADRAEAYADLALTVYTGMASIASKHASFQEHLGVVQFRVAEILSARGELEKAKRLYSEILKRTPDAADVLFRLGEIHEAQGSWEEALQIWRRYAEGTRAGSQAWLDSRYRIALAHSKMGRPKQACEVVTMLRVLHPEAGDGELRKKVMDLEKAVCRTGDQGSTR